MTHEFCKSHYLSQFATFFIDVGAKTSPATGCIIIIVCDIFKGSHPAQHDFWVASFGVFTTQPTLGYSHKSTNMQHRNGTCENRAVCHNIDHPRELSTATTPSLQTNNTGMSFARIEVRAHTQFPTHTNPPRIPQVYKQVTQSYVRESSVTSGERLQFQQNTRPHEEVQACSRPSRVKAIQKDSIQ